MSRRLRVVGGAAILAAVVAVTGADAVPTALRSLDGPVLVAGTAVAAVTTTCAAWRWRVVARHLGLVLTTPAAVAGCYRAQFLNLTLPGGVLGDVDRGLGHGRQVDDVGRALRAVAWERTCGQVVLIAATGVALGVGRWSWAPWPALPAWVPALAATVAGLGALAVLVRPGGVLRLMARTLAVDARALAAPRAVVPALAASLVVLGGHVVTFGLAARAVDGSLGPARLVPVALVVLLVGALPVNVAGWGPREGAAAWVFASAGSDAATGLAVAVAYGLIVLVAALPGALLLVVGATAPAHRLTRWTRPRARSSAPRPLRGVADG